MSSGKRRLVSFYWKTACHTCRTARNELEARGIAIEAIDIMKDPPSRETLMRLIGRYGAKAMVRRNAKEYKTMQIGKMDLSEDKLAELLHDHPDVASRPIVLVGKQAFLARDPRLRKHLKVQRSRQLGLGRAP